MDDELLDDIKEAAPEEEKPKDKTVDTEHSDTGSSPHHSEGLMRMQTENQITSP